MNTDDPLSPTGRVLTRTRSQETTVSSPIPYAAYPPDNAAVQQLGRQVQIVVEEQATRIAEVQDAVGAQGQQTYAQLVALHQQQQKQAQEQMALNEQLMQELRVQRERQEELMAQLQVQKTRTEAHERGLHAAAASSVYQANALEEMKRRTSARWTAFTAAPPVAAPAPTPNQPVQMVYGFQEVPKAPSYNGSTKAEKRKFMDQYEAYCREISLANAARPGGQQIQQMPLSGCINSLAVQRIAFWEIGKIAGDLTEADWRAYFLEARVQEPLDLVKVNAAMAKLKMDLTVQSAESRVSKLVSDFETILVRLSLEGFAESEPRMTVDYLIAAIQPVAVQKRVAELMKLQENKAFKKDARAFKSWLCEYMRRYGEFEPVFGAAPQTPAAPKPRVQDVKPEPTGRKKKKGTVAAVSKVPGKVPDSNFLTAEKACWKCLSKDHNVFACPKAAEGEAKILMERAREVWAAAKKVT